MANLYLRKNKKTSKIPIIIFIIMLGIFCSYRLIYYIDKIAEPIFMSFAELETKKIVTMIINKSLTDKVLKNNDFDKLFDIKMDNNNNDIQLINYNNFYVNELLSEITNSIYKKIRNIENGEIKALELSDEELEMYNLNNVERGIIYRIPIGVASKSNFLSALGPRIPVRFRMIGSVTSNIVTNVKEYGINNAILEVGIEVVVSGRIYITYASKEVIVKNVIPLSTKIIQGNIPNYYLNGFTTYSGLKNSTP